MQVRVGAIGTGGTFHVEFNGENKTGTLSVPDTGDWQTFAAVTSTVNLTAGVQIMRLMLDMLAFGGWRPFRLGRL